MTACIRTASLKTLAHVFRTLPLRFTVSVSIHVVNHLYQIYPKPKWINVNYWISINIHILIDSSSQLDRVLAYKTTQIRPIVSRTVVVQAVYILLPPRVLVRIRIRRAGLTRRSIRIILIPLHSATARIRQQPRAAQHIGQEVRPPAGVVAGVTLIDAQAGQDRIDRAALRFLHHILSVVQIIGGRAGLAP